ncbi:MAG TPA: class I SAM-dependent methyltransferase [Thermomicrobiales bacterium]|nr:class I SAM-dependent methyltransferase [Thermomicrobiales bacterium]
MLHDDDAEPFGGWMDKPYAETVRRNARRWEAMAHHRLGMTVEDHRTGDSPLWTEEVALLGELRGQRVLHLACAVCDEGIAMAMAGAVVTGLDAAPTHLQTGREKAAALGVEVDLRLGDMMALPDDLGPFDLAYISSGGLCWVPDLDDWLEGVSRVLKPGGRLLITEHHPLWKSLGVAGERALVVQEDYFGQRELAGPRDPGKSAIGVAQTAESPDELHSFVWGIGAIVSALLRHGFRIAALQEFPDAAMYGGLGDAADCIPAVYILVGERV